MEKLRELRASIVRCIRRKAHSDSAFSFLINFLFRFFSSTIIAGLTTILGTIAIAVMVGKGYYEWPFWISCVVYCIFTLCIGWANGYMKHKVKDTQQFQKTLWGISTVLEAWAFIFQKSAKKLKNIDDIRSNPEAVNGALSEMDFQAAAITVCQRLSELLAGFKGLKEVYVTVYQRFKNPYGTDYCKMIAFSTNREPTSFNKKFPIPRNSNAKIGEIALHSYIFSSGKTDIFICPDKESVKKAFKIHEGCEEREKEICQYIGIPITPSHLGITFILQVDTSVPNLFGENKETIKEFSENTIVPFAQFLHMIYEQGRMVEQILR